MDSAHDRVQLNHNLMEAHPTYTLTSELQNPCKLNSISLSVHHVYISIHPVYQDGVVDDHDPDASLNLDSLLIQLRVQVTPKWYQFGVAIGVPDDLLQQYSSYPADERLIEVLDYWLKNNSYLSWRDVAKILHDIELHELADGIMNVYETGSFLFLIH